MSEQIGDYRVLRPLGEGSFGQLLLAEGRDGHQVVIKRLKLEAVVDEKALELFHREAGVLRSLRHTAVPRFLHTGIDEDGVPYLVQDYIAGDTLHRAVREGRRFSSAEALTLTRKLLEALEYLHDLHPPVIHRDIKPANIVLAADGPVIVDFGAVCGRALVQGEISDTVVGTFGYMAPEQLKGRAQPASDLYSLGATLLYAFSGREPESFPTERLRIRFRDAVALPRPLLDLLESLLEPAAEDRPQSAGEALARLRGEGALAPTGRGDVAHPPHKSLARRRIVAVAGGAIALALVVALVLKGPAYVLGLLKTAGIGMLVLLVVFLIFVSLGGGC